MLLISVVKTGLGYKKKKKRVHQYIELYLYVIVFRSFANTRTELFMSIQFYSLQFLLRLISRFIKKLIIDIF